MDRRAVPESNRLRINPSNLAASQRHPAKNPAQVHSSLVPQEMRRRRQDLVSFSLDLPARARLPIVMPPSHRVALSSLAHHNRRRHQHPPLCLVLGAQLVQVQRVLQTIPSKWLAMLLLLLLLQVLAHLRSVQLNQLQHPLEIVRRQRSCLEVETPQTPAEARQARRQGSASDSLATTQTQEQTAAERAAAVDCSSLVAVLPPTLQLPQQVSLRHLLLVQRSKHRRCQLPTLVRALAM